MQNVAGDDKAQLTAAGCSVVVSDSQAVTVAVDDAVNEASTLNVSACPPPADTAESEPTLPVDADHPQNCSDGGIFISS